MGANGKLRITTLWSFTASTNNKTLRVKYGGTTFTDASVAANLASARYFTEISNRNLASSQVGGAAAHGGWGSTSNPPVTSTLNTNSPLNILLTAQLATSTETATLESYLVELLPAQ